MAMRLIIDQAMCQGHGRCAEMIPLDDMGYASVSALEVPEGSEALASAVALGCPERAITVEGATNIPA